MKVWELRERIARMDGDDNVVLRVHALRWPTTHGKVEADEMLSADECYREVSPIPGEDRPAGSRPRVRCLIIEGWVEEL